MTTRMKPVSWHERPRMNRIASIMYPGLADPQAQNEMDYFAKQDGKRSPVDLRGGITKSTEPSVYDRVPGLHRK
jgi:hypothetical protein